MPLRKEAFGNILGKGENAGNQHFLLFPKCFLPFQKLISNFESTFILLSARALNLDPVNFVVGKELSIYCTIKTVNNPEEERF